MLNTTFDTVAPYSGCSKEPKPYRKYAKIICHLRDDVRLSDTLVPDSASIHQLTKKYFDERLNELSWEEAVYRLINQIKLDAFCQAPERDYSVFFQHALLQLKRATFGSHIWVH